MVNQYDLTEQIRNLQVPPDIQDLLNSIINGIMILAARAANSNSDSNSLGGTSLPSFRIFPSAFGRFQPGLQEAP